MLVIRQGDYIVTQTKSPIVCQVLKAHRQALYVEEVLSRRRFITMTSSAIVLTPAETARLLLKHWTLGVLHPLSPYRGHYR